MISRTVNLNVVLLSVLICGISLPAKASWFSSDDGVSDAPNAYTQRYGSGQFEIIPPTHSLPAPRNSFEATAPAVSLAPSAALTPPFHVATNPTVSAPAPMAPLAPEYQTAPAPIAFRPQSEAASQSSASTDKRAELNVTAVYDNDPSSDVNGGSSYGLDTTVYSNTIDHKWRIFAGELFMHELEPFGEDKVNYSRSTAGLEYTHNDIEASLAPTFNDYNGSQRVGASGDLTWYATNNWAFGGGAQLFSRDISLRALSAGVTANSYDANASWFQSNTRLARFDVEALNYSDGNFRTILTGSDIEHLFKNSNFTIDGLGSMVESQNSKDENRSYYNPRQDILGSLGARVTQPLYKSAAFTYDHSVDVKPGVYWQKDYGTSGAVTAGYTQHINYRDDIDAAVSVDFTRQDADGESNNDLAFLLNLSKKL